MEKHLPPNAEQIAAEALARHARQAQLGAQQTAQGTSGQALQLTQADIINMRFMCLKTIIDSRHTYGVEQCIRDAGAAADFVLNGPRAGEAVPKDAA